jgi:hypothetical protein
MLITVTNIDQETNFIFQIQICYITRSENNIFISSPEDYPPAIPVNCTFHKSNKMTL